MAAAPASIAYFKKYSLDDIASQAKVKSSVQRGMKRSIVEQYPLMEEKVESLFPRGDAEEAKGRDRITFVVVDKQPLFFHMRDGPYFPTLRVLHRFPNMMPRLQVDKGAMRALLNGADMMCPGFTSAGGRVDIDVPEGTPVAIYVEGKEHAIAVGLTTMPTADIKRVNKGVAVQIVHYLNDGLWRIGRTFEL